MYRNMFQEFSRDQRMSPLIKGKKSLSDDWMMTRFIPSSTAQNLNIAPELLRIQIRFVLDAPHKLSKVATDIPGRIIYISLPEIRGSRIIELTRGVSLGEAYDFASLISDDELMSIVYTLYKSVLMSPSEYAEYLQQQSNLDEIKSGAGHPKRQDGHYAFETIRGVKTLVWISDELAKERKEHYENITARAEKRAMLFMVRGVIRDALKNDTLSEVVPVITHVMKEQGDEGIVAEALELEMKSLAIRLEASKNKTKKK